MPRPTVTSFDPQDFRRIGATAEFDPRVGSSYTGPVRVVKVNPKSLIVEDVHGTQIRTDHWSLVPTGQTFTPSTEPRPVLGTIVRVAARNTPGLFVVIGIRDGKAKVAALGGDHDRFLRAVPMSRLTIVDPKEVLK